jgi:iron complex outermembrane recepter protein
MLNPIVKSALYVGLSVSSIFNSSLVLAEELPTVVVSSTRSEQSNISTSSSILIINKSEIQESGANNVTEVLRGRGGVQVSDLFGDGSSSSISMRGFAGTAGSNVLIMVDGRRLNYSDTRSPDLSYISINDIERIEIVQGSSGVLFGDQAVGGVINIITSKPEKLYSAIELQAGSYNRNGVAYILSDKKDNGFFYKLNAEAYQTDNYRDHNEHSNVNVSANTGIEYAKGSVFLELQKVEDDLQTPGALVQSALDINRRQINAGFVDDFTNSDTEVKRLGLSHELSDMLVFEADITSRKVDQEIEVSFQNTPSGASGFGHRDLKSINPRLIGSIAGDFGETLVTLGIDREDSAFNLFIPNAFGMTRMINDQDTKSIYAQVVTPLNSKLTAIFGARKAKIDNKIVDMGFTPVNVNVKDSGTVKELGLNYQVSKEARVFVRMDDNYRFAKVDEFSQALNTSLVTQTGKSWEAGYAREGHNSSYKITLYRLNLENEIYFDPVLFANINLDNTTHDGLILDYGGSVSDSLAISFNYTYTNAELTEGNFNGNEISGVADNLASLRMTLKINEKTTLYGEVIGVDDKYAQGDNANTQEKIRGYAVFNASASYKVKKLLLSIKVNNILNKEYTEFVTNNGFGAAYQPSPERNLLLTARYEF